MLFKGRCKHLCIDLLNERWIAMCGKLMQRYHKNLLTGIRYLVPKDIGARTAMKIRDPMVQRDVQSYFLTSWAAHQF